jgi:hypothetical protein
MTADCEASCMTDCSLPLIVWWDQEPTERSQYILILGVLEFDRIR